MPDLEETVRQLRARAREAMQRRRMARPGSEAYRRADERVLYLNELINQLIPVVERRRRLATVGATGSRGW